REVERAVDRHGVDVDDHLVRTGPGVRHVGQFEHLRAAEAVLDDGLHAGSSSSLSSATRSSSTATPRGSDDAPTAKRVWRPASPNTATSRSDAPFITKGWSLKSGVAWTKPDSLTMPATLERSPAAA